MMFTRPPLVRAIALAYIVSPLANVAQAAFTSGHSLEVVARQWLLGFGTFGAALVLGAPLAGIGIYSGRRWGFVLFFLYSFALLFDSGLRLPQGNFAYKASILIVDLAVLVAVSLVLREDIRAPFLSDEERGWRMGKRMPASGTARLVIGKMTLDATLVNISVTGALVTCAGAVPPLGTKGTMTFTGVNGDISVPVGVVRSDAQGVALGFVEPEWTTVAAVLKSVLRTS